MDLKHHIADELKMSEMKLQSVVSNREQVQYTPVNGSQGYSYNGKNEIELVVATSHLVDLQSMFLSFDIDASCNDLASNVFQSITVYINDEQTEYIDNINKLEEMLQLVSGSKTHYETDLNILQGAHKFSEHNTARSGSFVWGMSCVGLTSVKQFLPMANLRLVVRLADPSVCTGGNAYTLNNVKLNMDLIEVIPSYEARLKSLIRSDKGVAIPIVSVEHRSRQLKQLNTVNLSYTELQSAFFLVDTDGGDITDMPFGDEFKNLKVSMNNKYFGSTVQGISSLPQAWVSLKKALGGSMHDATGHSVLNYQQYKNEFTPFGVDFERISGDHYLMRNGVNTKELAYAMDLQLDFDDSSVPANAKLDIFCMFKKVMVMSNNGVKVLE
jgi:hypothetical protein